MFMPIKHHKEQAALIVPAVAINRLTQSKTKQRVLFSRGRLKCSSCVGYFITVLLIQNILMTYVILRRNKMQTFMDMSFNVPSTALIDETKTAMSVNRSESLRDNETTSVSVSDRATTTTTTVTGKPKINIAKSSKSEMPEQQFYQKRSKKVNPYTYNFRLVPNGACRDDTKIIVIVHSDPTYADRRASIRETWGHAIRTSTWPVVVSQNSFACCSHMELVFVIGVHRDPAVNSAVEQEFLVHRDIVQGDFLDDYRNMTLKSLLDLKFAIERCPHVDYLIKSDDDMIINLPYLLDVIKSKEPLRRSIMGPLNGASAVYRRGVWALTFEEYPYKRFPPYESGSTYVITADIIKELYDTAEYVPWIFIDDVYITGILGKIIGVSHVHQQGFAFWGTKRPTACDIILRKVLTGTKLTAQRLFALWDQLLQQPKC